MVKAGGFIEAIVEGATGVVIHTVVISDATIGIAFAPDVSFSLLRRCNEDHTSYKHGQNYWCSNVS
jgi:hypothetical protein